ncbi:hypothetical protein VNI00_006723 [Paramarasmius palmivorus]|uniref:FAD-binding domain-containing protein n=1 Tax=Paramarasmius palmivorus TaxID=297713 RepID=A0AAW0D8N5_9AGAR
MSTQSAQPAVLISGAGPSGLVLALLLLRNGVPVRIIDKRNEFNVGQRGAGLHARTLELYKLLGILPEVEKRSTPMPLRKIYLPGNNEPIVGQQIVEELPTESHIYRINGVIFRQEEHQKLLREVLRADYGCEVESSTELESFTQDDEGVSVNLVKEGKRETTRVQWLVGADGAHSVVRKQLGLTFLGETHANIAVLIGDIEIENLGILDDKNWRSFGIALLSPYTKDGKQMAFFLISGAQVDAEELSKSPESIVRALHEVLGERGVEFGSFYQRAIWRANVRMANKFGEGRVFIVGGELFPFTFGRGIYEDVDAAHVHSPTGGQGMNSGVQDSFNLAWKLSLVHKGLSPSSFVESYNTERLPVMAAMLQLTTEIMKKDFAAHEDLRTGDKWKREFETRQLGITYRKSPILVDEKYTNTEEKVDPYRSGSDGTVRAGDRAPEASGLKSSESGETTSIYELLDVTSHTILLFGKSVAEVNDSLEVLAGYPRSLVKAALILPQGSEVSSSSLNPSLHQVLVDTEGLAFKNYQIQPGDSSAIAIRPDGVRHLFVVTSF